MGDFDELEGYIRYVRVPLIIMICFRLIKRAGDLVHIKVLGRSIIYVNSAEAATELFARRSTNYSDRPRLPLLNDMYV